MGQALLRDDQILGVRRELGIDLLELLSGVVVGLGGLLLVGVELLHLRENLLRLRLFRRDRRVRGRRSDGKQKPRGQSREEHDYRRPPGDRTPRGSTTGWAPIVVFLAALAAGLLLAVGSASADSSITSKQAQAQEVLAKVQQLYSDQEKAAEAYDYAGEQLKQIDSELATNTENLVVAKKSLAHSQQVIATRLRDLYVRGEGDSTLEVLLGSTSLEDVVNRLDAIERVSHQDSRILSDVKKYKKEVLDNRSRLEDAHAKQ